MEYERWEEEREEDRLREGGREIRWSAKGWPEEIEFREKI